MDILHPTDEEFSQIRDLVYDRFGINLTDEKRSLVAGRLQKVLRQRGFASFREYLAFISADKTGEAIEELANRITTNHTFFFREKDHFDFFIKVMLPQAIQRNRERGTRDIRVWSAGCSSGEEAYTLVMLMLEHFAAEYSAWSAGVLATDISAHALEIARAAEYPEERLELVPSSFKNKYFTKTQCDTWIVRDFVKREVTFRSLNLMNQTFPFKKPFDIIFCRNVMIYFDQQTRNALVRRFFDSLIPGGYLCIGHSESIRKEQFSFEYIMPAVYQKKG